MKVRNNSIWTVLFSLCLIGICDAAAASNAASPYELRSLLESRGSFLKPEQALQQLQGSLSGETNWGYQSTGVWLSFQISKEMSQRHRVNFQFLPALLSNIDLYRVDEGGSLNPISEQSLVRSERFPTYAFSPEGATSYLARVESIHALDLKVSVYDDESMLRLARFDSLFAGAFYGVLFACVLLMFLSWLKDRQRASLDFLVFTSIYAVEASTISGRLDHLIPTHTPVSRYLLTMSAASVLAGLQFTRSYLQLPRLLPNTDRLARVLMVPLAALGIFGISPWLPLHNVAAGHAIDVLILVAGGVILSSGLRVFRIGFAPAKPFALAWLALTLTLIVYFGTAYGLFDIGAWESYLIYLGSAIHTLILTLGLISRMGSISAERAVEAERLRTLVQMACHDLRNPLTAIVARAQAHLLGGRTEWREVLDAAQRQASILDYVSQTEAIDSGKRPLNVVALDLHPTIEGLRDSFRDWLSKKNIEFKNEIQASPPIRVKVDPALFAQTVLTNVTSNAIKFSHPGGKLIVRAEVDGGKVKITVTDFGVGIPSQLLSKLFSTSHPTTRLGTGGEAGTGFGMPLVHHALEAMGGSIRVESDSGVVGTRVYLTLLEALPAGRASLKSLTTVARRKTT